jgi:hypothetical protein
MSNTAADLNCFKSIYPEREEPDLSKMERAAAAVEGFLAPWLRPRAKRFHGIIRATDLHAEEIKAKCDGEIKETGRMLRQRLRREGFTPELTGWTFALVREAADRAIGHRHFDVQLLGGWILLQGMAAEMETGEGKTRRLRGRPLRPPLREFRFISLRSMIISPSAMPIGCGRFTAPWDLPWGILSTGWTRLPGGRRIAAM